MFPPISLVIPYFTGMRAFGLIDRLPALIIAANDVFADFARVIGEAARDYQVCFAAFRVMSPK